MSGILTNILNKENYHLASQVIDWLVDDEKFSAEKWGKGESIKMTKQMKNLTGFSSKHYHQGQISKISFPRTPLDHFAIHMQCDSAECKELIRHIRNGFAHGNVKLRKINGEKYLEIIDWGKSDKNDKVSRQTALLLFHISFVVDLYNLYERIRKTKDKNGN